MLQLFKRWGTPGPGSALSPLDRLLSLWLKFAFEERATAIVIGMPRTLPPEEAADVSSALCGGPDDELRQVHLRTDARGALAGSSRLKSAAGWETVPVWVRIDGRLYWQFGLPVSAHLAFLSRVEERLVSLDASEASPKAMRYLEYEGAGAAGERCFTEVELWLDEDNTVRIEILGHRREAESVRAVSSVY